MLSFGNNFYYAIVKTAFVTIYCYWFSSDKIIKEKQKKKKKVHVQQQFQPVSRIYLCTMVTKGIHFGNWIFTRINLANQIKIVCYYYDWCHSLLPLLWLHSIIYFTCLNTDYIIFFYFFSKAAYYTLLTS